VSGIYDAPEFYELACAYRDVASEVDVLGRWSQRYGDTPVRSVLELAAGPAEHSLEFSRRGAEVTALDLSPAMCARARDKAKRAGLALTVVEGDMRDIRVPGRFDLIITMLNSLCHLLTLDDLVAHLRSVTVHLPVGGLYIMELAHPADYLTIAPRSSSEWDTDLDDVHVHVRWGGPLDQIDPVTQVTMEHVSVTVRDVSGSKTVTDVVPNRFWTATEVTAAIRLADGLAVAGCHGDFDETTRLDVASAWRMILVLRRDA
jgi:SAM-dependent methyltransferase